MTSEARISVLFARRDSHYKSIPGVDVWDIDRDARLFDGSQVVIAHPPCRAWSKLKGLAKPRPGEKNLARLAVALVRAKGGVLEHPQGSDLWKDQDLPRLGEKDSYGGFTLGVTQHWFGHKAVKRTWLYIVGLEPRDIPRLPLRLGDSTHVVAKSRTRPERPEISKAEREYTPPDFAEWLVSLALQIAEKRANSLPVDQTKGVPIHG